MEQISISEELKVYEQRELCLQDEPPLCKNACPLGVNVRLLLKKAAEGKLEAAFSEYRKQVIFGEILARICDAPCRNACARGAGGEPIEVGLIERACAEHGNNKPVGNVFVRDRGFRAVVVGAGLTGLTCAYVLSRKGYGVDIYDERDAAGGSLREIDGLEDAVIDAELEAVLRSQFINTHFGERVTALEFGPDVPVFVATGAWGERFGVDISVVDAASMRDAESGLFFGGGVVGCTSPAEKIAAGKRAAAQIERVLKKEPLAAFEAQGETRLPFPEIPNTGNEAVRPANGAVYTREEASSEAARCLQCECMLCVKGCLMLRQGGFEPKAYIAHAEQSLKTLKLIQNKLAPRRTNACSQCGLCGEVCPAGVNMEEVYRKSRRIMHSTGELPEAFHSFWIKDMEFSQSEAFLCRPEPGYEQARYLFFPGCQMAGSGAEYVTEVYNYLRERLEGGVGLYLGCCGAPSEWSGYHELTIDANERFRDEWERLGGPEVLLACPTCEKMFLRYHPDVTVRAVMEVFGEYGTPPQALWGAGAEVSVFDPCSSRGNPDGQRAVRGLLEKMGFRIRELEYSGALAQCCGYGGMIYSSNPDLKREIIGARVVTGELPFVTYCVNCREELAAGGKEITHIFDLLFGRDGFAKETVTLSQRRERRRALKPQLLCKLWGESCMEENTAMVLIISETVAEGMDRDLILEDDIRKVIENATRLNERILTERGTIISHLLIDPITYWVEYRELDGAYEIVNAYVHRMQIQERGTGDG